VISTRLYHFIYLLLKRIHIGTKVRGFACMIFNRHWQKWWKWWKAWKM